jgi:ABC-type Zn uptake system ZnuABC Zn-binding protein ZnuA
MEQKMIKTRLLPIFTLCAIILSACQSTPTPNTAKPQSIKVVAVESFLADIAQNVAGDRFTVTSLIPINVEPHAYEPTPRDVAQISECNVLIINGGGIEQWVDPLLKNTGGEHLLIESSKGLPSRTQGEIDPHFWLDPSKVVTYVENIRDGFIQIDPQGKATYTTNASVYISKLKELDTWVKTQIDLIPAEKRMLVTNHESFGYFADRYGFKIIGTIIPSVSTEASPSAQQMAALIDQIRASKSTAIFLETGTNADLAKQIASETGAKIITDLYTHSLTNSDGPAPTYLQMIKSDVNTIVTALK